VNKLYHLSVSNHNGEVFSPRVPESIWWDKGEDNKKKRICFSTSMSGAFRAINFDGYEEELYIHIPENLEKVNKHCWKPSVDEVEDVDFTGEKWVTCKVNMKCIGKAVFSYKNGSFWSLGPWRPKVRIKYLEYDH